MVFYDDFVKKIDGSVKGIGTEKFGMEAKRAAMWLGTGIPFFIAGILEIYIAYSKNFSKYDFFVGVIFIFLSLRHLRLYFSYKITLDFNEKKLKSRDVNFNFKDVVLCTLKEQAVGKRRRQEVVLDIITVDNKQIIIPLMMRDKLRFANLMKSELKTKFRIEK